MRNISFFLGVILAFCAASTRVESARADEPAYEVGAVNSLTKVRRHEAAVLDGKIAIEAARNEIEPFQVIVRASQPLKKVRLSITDLKGPAGVIKADQFEPFIQYYHRIEKESDMKAFPAAEATSTVGQFWPDALLPYEPFDVQEGNQGLWIQLRVPADAAAGTYAGSLTVAPENAPPKQMEIELTVWDFTLPMTPSFHMMGAVHIGPDPFAAGPQGSEAWKKQWKERTLWFLDQGMSPCWLISDQAAPADWSPFPHRRFTESFAEYLNHPNCTTVQMSFYEPDWEDPSRHEALRQSTEWVKKRWGDKIATIIRTADEPPADTYPDLRQNGIAIHKIDPNLKVLLTARDISPALEGGVDYWCPFFTEIGNRIGLDLIRKRREQGEQVWFYANDFTFPIDIQAIHHRVVGWAAAGYGLQGEYQFGVNWWLTEKGYSDPFKTPMSGANGWNGGSWLAWPGEALGKKGLLSSIRLSEIRQWMEDCDYFEILKGRIAAVQKQLKFDDRWLADDRAWEIASAVITDAYHYNPDADHLFAARRALAQEIIQTTRPPLVALAMSPRSGEMTDLDRLSVRGAVEAGARLQINGTDQAVDAAGHFDLSMPLTAGENPLAITITRESQTKVLHRTVTYKPDSTLVSAIRQGVQQAAAQGVEIPARLPQVLSYYEKNGGWGDARRRDEAKRLYETLQMNRYRAMHDKLRAAPLPDAAKQPFLEIAQNRAQSGQFAAAADMLAEGLKIDAAGPCSVAPVRYEDYYGWQLDNGLLQAVVLEEGARIMTLRAGDVPLLLRGLVRALDLGEITWRDIGGYEDVLGGRLDPRLSQQPWTIQITRAAAEQVTLRAQREFTDPLGRKLRIARTLSLKKDSPSLEIQYEIHNLGREQAAVDWRAHISPAVGVNPHNSGGDPENDRFILADDAAQSALTLPSYDSKAHGGLATEMIVKLDGGYIAAFDPAARAALAITTSQQIPYAYLWYESNDPRPYDNPWQSTRNRYTIEPNNTLGAPPAPFVIPPLGSVKFKITLSGPKDIGSVGELRQRIGQLAP